MKLALAATLFCQAAMASIPKQDDSGQWSYTIKDYGTFYLASPSNYLFIPTAPTNKALEIRSLNKEIMRITPQGKIYLRGKLIGQDRELGKVLNSGWK